jgi:pyruvate carboxylase
MRARGAAREAGVSVLRASEAVEGPDEALAAAEEIGYPVFVKAAGGGGGRGLRRVEGPEQLSEAVEAAVREAEAAFGDPTVFLEEAITRPRHTTRWSPRSLAAKGPTPRTTATSSPR